MDKKAKKRIELLNKRLQKLRQQMAGVRQQLDDPTELAKFEEEIQAVETEIATLKESQTPPEINVAPNWSEGGCNRHSLAVESGAGGGESLIM